MKKYLSLVGAIFLFISLMNPLDTKAEIEKTYLIGFNSVINEKVINKHGGKIKNKYKFMPVAAVSLSDKAAQALSKNPNISYIEEDSKVHVTGQEVSWGLSHVNGDVVQQTGITGNGVKIGVIDTGIDYTHEDLKVVGGVNFVDNAVNYIDDNGHGTHVAGIISALNNVVGVLGLAPQADLYAIKALDKYGNGNYSDVIAGIEWAITNDMDIINMSLEGSSGSRSLQQILDNAYNAGVLLVASAGNKGYDKKGTITYPAKYNTVIAVGAVNQYDYRTEFSSVGRELELVAPGIQINSTVPGGYAQYDGTSMAAPHVSGIASLLMEANPLISNSQIRKILNDTAKPLGDSFSYGNGLVDAIEVVNYIQDQEIVSETGIGNGNKSNKKWIFKSITFIKDNQ